MIVIVAAAYYGISPLFLSIRLDEPMPVQDSGSDTTIPTEQTALTKLATVVGTTFHPASGFVRIVKDENGKTYLRYENYKTINGPDLFVYLSKDKEATDFINLGALKGTEGSINYEVPNGVNIDDYMYALTWCRQFGVLFNYADLTMVR